MCNALGSSHHNNIIADTERGKGYSITMTYHVVLAAIGLVVLLIPSCDAFVARPEHLPLISTELGLKTTGMQFYDYPFCFIFVCDHTASNNFLLFALLYAVLSTSSSAQENLIQQ